MAREADDTAQRGNVYAAIRDAEEEKFARRGGRLALVRTADGVQAGPVSDPGPLLSALRRGEPVEVPAWKLPREFRDRAQDTPGRVVVHADGRVVAV